MSDETEIYTPAPVTNTPEIYTPEGVTKVTKEDYEARQQWLNREITLNELRDMLNLTVRHDNSNKVITFLSMLLTYTDQDQVNIAFNAESSSGKSYVPLEIARYFPQEDVMTLAYCSPTAFFHEYGEFDEETFVKRIDLSKKILIFLDMPHDQLLQRLRPLLSHDRKELLVKITDRSRSRGLGTKQVLLIGYPTVIFCSTRYSLDNQERTRCILLSPEIHEAKIKDALELISQKQANRRQYKEYVDTSREYMFLGDRVNSIKRAGIEEVIIPEELREEVVDQFKEIHKHFIPRHMRDFPRLFAFIKACTLLNHNHREKVNNHLIATRVDIFEAFTLYETISKPNELGIPPEVYEFYEKVFQEAIMENGYASSKDLAKRYYETYHKTIGAKRLKKIIDMLLETGLVLEGKDPNDGRITVWSHPAGYIFPESEAIGSHVEGYISPIDGDEGNLRQQQFNEMTRGDA